MSGEEVFKNSGFEVVHWALSYALLAKSQGYLPDETLIYADKIDMPITRLEMAGILARICNEKHIKGISAEDDPVLTFTDMDGLDDDSIDYVENVANKGFIKGYPDGTFGPNKTMTRAECATIITRFLMAW